MLVGTFPGGHWHPSSDSLLKIRRRLVKDPEAWKKVIGEDEFQKRFHLAGDSLKRAPRGFPADHELIEDLKRKDFIAVRPLKPGAPFKKGFVDRLTEDFVVSRPFLEFVCRSQGLAF